MASKRSIVTGVLIGAVTAGGVTGALVWPSPSAATDPSGLAQLARDAVGEDPEPAIAALRARGHEGHEALLRIHASSLEALRAGSLEPERAEALRHAIDVVSGQRDGHASGLYWHTDLEAAKAEARRTGRPILSLRLLGRLDEELSCANSRFFRIVLYSDPEVAARLHEDYVLHWSMERPAPRMEIDMGDGRRIVRTITGNSAHYVLDASGRPVDVLVGLYGPQQFLRALASARAIHDACRASGDREGCLAREHTRAEEQQVASWEAARQAYPVIGTWADAVASLPEEAAAVAPDAELAMPRTIAKASVETVALDRFFERAIAPAPAPRPAEPTWATVAVASDPFRPLSEPTLALLRLKMGTSDVGTQASRLAFAARSDGARNEVMFRRRVHGWFAARAVPPSFTALNDRVYRELMLTPASDPWIGLRGDAELYDGVDVSAGAR
ncbi:MAG: hypothetical protein AB7S26_37760 [Sandaracinaceae bacterium]